MGEADKEYQSIVGLVREVESIVKQHQIPGGLENPYTTLTAHVRNIVILKIASPIISFANNRFVNSITYRDA